MYCSLVAYVADTKQKKASHTHKMTFEQGVKYAIEWMQGKGPHPLEDEGTF